jgi:hypothetical protein
MASQPTTKRERKKPERFDYDEDGAVKSSQIPKIPSWEWFRFPQSDVNVEKLLSRKGKPFNGEYLLSDGKLPDGFDIGQFCADNPTKRWAIICSGFQKAPRGSEPLVNPFKIPGKTHQTLVSSLWISKCRRFHLFPDSRFRFEGDDADNQQFWMPNENYTEYHCLPKSLETFLFLHPTDWDTAITKLEVALKKHREVSSSSDVDGRKHSKKCNKNSPVKMDPILVPLREREKEEAKIRKSAEKQRKLEEERTKKSAEAAKMRKEAEDEEAKSAEAAEKKKKAADEDAEKKKADDAKSAEAAKKKKADEESKAVEEANKVPAIKVLPLPAKKLTEPVHKAVFPLGKNGPPPAAASKSTATEAYVRALVLDRPPPTIGKYFKIPI